MIEDGLKHRRALGSNWLLWWRINPEALKRQVDDYSTLKFYQSARGMSAMLLLFSSVLTIGLMVVGTSDWSASFDVLIAVGLCIAVWRGRRWAIVVAMMYWSVEKGYQLCHMLPPYTSIRKLNSSPIIPIVWWAVYMSPFYLAFKTEEARQSRPIIRKFT